MNLSLSINRRRVFKCLAYIAVTTLAYVLATARSSAAEYWLPTMNIMPFIAAALGFYEGPYMAGAMGFYGGMLLSLSSSTTEGAEAIILGLFGVFCGSVGVTLMRRMLPSCMTCAFGLMAARGVISATYYRIFYSISFSGVLLSHLEIMAVSLIPGAACYFIVAAISRRFDNEEEGQ